MKCSKKKQVYPHLHKLFVADLNPTIPIGVKSEMINESSKYILNAFTYPWKASVIVLTVTHALTNRSKVIPGRGPYPVIGWEANTF